MSQALLAHISAGLTNALVAECEQIPPARVKNAVQRFLGGAKAVKGED